MPEVTFTLFLFHDEVILQGNLDSLMPAAFRLSETQVSGYQKLMVLFCPV
jgi:hypothetical protein